MPLRGRASSKHRQEGSEAAAANKTTDCPSLCFFSLRRMVESRSYHHLAQPPLASAGTFLSLDFLIFKQEKFLLTQNFIVGKAYIFM